MLTLGNFSSSSFSLGASEIQIISTPLIKNIASSDLTKIVL
jgi:hypothetical protein